jgi:hypothetical protein
MTVQSRKDELLQNLERAVQDTLGYFAGPGQGSTATIDQWGAWDVLAHFPYWHAATAWGIASASLGGPPWLVSASADEVNAAALAVHAGESFDDLVHQLHQAQARLVRVAQAAPDLDAPAFQMPDGRRVSVGQRLETIARHWQGHLDALRAAGG